MFHKRRYGNETNTDFKQHKKDHYLCTICKKTLKKGDVPKFAVPDCIRKNKSIATLKTINELEERLVALRLPFLQIRDLGIRYQKPQLGLSGGVINVHADISRIQHAFP